VKANVVRFATAAIGLVSIAVAFVDRLPADIPAYAFGDASVLRAERGLALLAILFIAFVALWRGIAEGELPIEISREGVKYQQREVTSETAATLRELEVSVVRQDRAIRRIVNILDRHVGEVEAQGRALARLEARIKEVPPDDQARS
jgi:hypothetical protein